MYALMMRSRSWLISAWKPKLSEAIFERECREKVEGERCETMRKMEGPGEAVAAGRGLKYMPPTAIREPSIFPALSGKRPPPPHQNLR